MVDVGQQVARVERQQHRQRREFGSRKRSNSDGNVEVGAPDDVFRNAVTADRVATARLQPAKRLNEAMKITP